MPAIQKRSFEVYQQGPRGKRERLEGKIQDVEKKAGSRVSDFFEVSIGVPKFAVLPADRDGVMLYVAVSASHVILSCDCGKILVVYSSIDHINAT